MRAQGSFGGGATPVAFSPGAHAAPTSSSLKTNCPTLLRPTCDTRPCTCCTARTTPFVRRHAHVRHGPCSAAKSAIILTPHPFSLKAPVKASARFAEAARGMGITVNAAFPDAGHVEVQLPLPVPCDAHHCPLFQRPIPQYFLGCHVPHVREAVAPPPGPARSGRRHRTQHEIMRR